MRLDGGGEQITDVVRALDADELRVANIELHAPSLDDVFLEKTGRHLEGAGDEAADGDGQMAASRARERRRHRRAAAARPRLDPGDPGRLARRPRRPAHPAPAGDDRPEPRLPLFLLAVNSAGLNAATQIPGFPTDSYLTFALAVPFIQGALFATMNSGQALAEDIENGFFNRLALTPMRGSALIAGSSGAWS